MELLVKFVLSLAKLLKNPVAWFSKQPWFLRMMWSLSLIPLISAVSILSYQKMAPQFNGQANKAELVAAGSIQPLKEEMNKLHDAQIKEILSLREDVAALKKLLQPSSTVDAIIDNSDSVLGTQTQTAVGENLRQRLEKFATDNRDDSTKLAYTIDGQDEVVVYLKPATSTKQITNLIPDTFYVVTQENEDWLQIDLDNGQSGWIEKKFVMTLPIHENN